MKHWQALLLFFIVLGLLFCITSCQKWNSIIVGFQRVVGHDDKAPRTAQFCDTAHFPYHYDTVYKAYNNMPTDLPQGLETDNQDGTRDYYFYKKVVSVNGTYGVKTNIPEPDFSFFK